MVVLTPEDQRVLGCLVEKEAFTPDAYPLTLNSLVLACNQASNRDPIVTYDEATVAEALGRLREQGLVRVVHSASYRATKYRHVATEAWALTSGEAAVLAVLLLRGSQTANELRARTERYGADIDELGGLEAVLSRLATGKEEPFVARLERRAGRREERWTHLLGPGPGGAADGAGGTAGDRARPEPARQPMATTPIAALQAQVAELRDELGRLRREVEELRLGLAKSSETQTSVT